MQAILDALSRMGPASLPAAQLPAVLAPPSAAGIDESAAAAAAVAPDPSAARFSSAPLLEGAVSLRSTAFSARDRGAEHPTKPGAPLAPRRTPQPAPARASGAGRGADSRLAEAERRAKVAEASARRARALAQEVVAASAAGEARAALAAQRAVAFRAELSEMSAALAHVEAAATNLEQDAAAARSSLDAIERERLRQGWRVSHHLLGRAREIEIRLQQLQAPGEAEAQGEEAQGEEAEDTDDGEVDRLLAKYGGGLAASRSQLTVA